MDSPGTRYSSPNSNLFVDDTLSFKRKGGCFVAKSSGLLLLFVVIVIIVATALITRHLTKQQYEEERAAEIGGFNDLKQMTRLNQNVIPLHYKLMLKPYLNFSPDGKEMFRLSGNEKILLETMTAVSSLEINGVGLNFSTDHVKLMKIENYDAISSNLSEHNKWAQIMNSNISKLSEVSVRSVVGNDTNETYSILLDSPTEVNGLYVLQINFSAPIYDFPEGIGYSKYTDQNGFERLYAVSYFEPTHARKAFPCFDEPGFKATFDISILRGSNMSSLSNMKIKSMEESSKGWIWDHYKTSPPMPTYLVAIVVSDFSNWNYNSGHVEINVWSRGALVQKNSHTSMYTQNLIDFYTFYFNSSYKLPKLDIVVLPHMPAITTDSWGLIKLSETMFWGLEHQSINSLLALSHKLAQQWLGNLVTIKWWNDIWLTESLANYLQYMAVYNISQNSLVMELFVKNELQQALTADSLNSTHALYVEQLNTTDILNYFDNNSFKKGAALFHMLQNRIGDTFKTGLQNLLQQRACKNVEPNDFWNTLTEAAQKNETLKNDFGGEVDIMKIMKSWITNPGYPILNVFYDQTIGNLRLNQEQFNLPNNESTSLWYIPISYTIKDGNMDGVSWPKNDWLKELTDAEIPITNKTTDTWILVNPMSTGFYRVNYEEVNWYLLMNEMVIVNNNSLTSSTKAQLIDDAFQLAKVGKLNYSIPLNITKFLINNDVDFLPWNTELQHIRFLELFFWDSPHYPLFQEYIFSILQPTYNKIEQKLSVNGQVHNLLAYLIETNACLMGIPECVKKARETYDSWKNTAAPESYNLIGYAIKTTAFCIGARHGGKSDTELMWQTYKNLTSKPMEQSEMLKALTCSTKPWVVIKLLTESLSNNSILQSEDVKILWAGFSGNLATAETAFNFFQRNWRIILTRYKNDHDLTKYIIGKFSSFLSTEDHLKRLLELKNVMRLDEKTGKWQLEKAIERLQLKVNWRMSQMPNVISWLLQF